jgi:hypothetical protein
MLVDAGELSMKRPGASLIVKLWSEKKYQPTEGYTPKGGVRHISLADQ